MSKLTALIGFIFLAVSSAWAQTPPANPGSPPAGDAAAAGSGIADYWWLIVLVVIVAAAIWYFSRSRGRSRNQL
jgi:heme/copper-type cytochrome/quinol oxidase subunit 2